MAGCCSRNFSKAAAARARGDRRPISQSWRVRIFTGSPAARRTWTACDWLKLLISLHVFSRSITGAIVLWERAVEDLSC